MLFYQVFESCNKAEIIWFWIAIEPKNKEILSITMFKEGNMSVVNRFLPCLSEKHDKRPVSTDGDTWYSSQAYRFLKLKHHLHSSWKTLIERTIQYVKDIAECFDDYFTYKKKKCKLKHVQQWMNLFVDYSNKE